MLQPCPGRAKRIIRYGLILLYCLLGAAHAWSKGTHIWVLQSDDSATYNTAFDAFKETVEIAPIKLHRINITEEKLPQEKPAYIIAIGTAATEKAFSIKPDCPVLSLLVTESGFKELAKRYKKSTDHAFEQNYSALVLEQPLLRYFSLGKSLIPKAKKVGLLIGPNTKYRKLEAETVANALDLELLVASIDNDSNPVRVLEPVIADADFFIVVPDTNTINQITARWILELSYRHSTPVIGYSARYAEAGALAGIFTTPQSLGRQAGQWLLQSLVNRSSRGQLLGPQDLQIVLNPSVARANNLTLKHAEAYRQLLVPGGISP
jgi:putative ABC transport system substrate-binding protein